MSAVDPRSVFPLEGRDIAQVTRDELLNAIALAPEIKQGGPPVARITSSVVVKYGRHVRLFEAENMRYVSKNTSIRLPLVIDAWEADDKKAYDESNSGYIVMEYVEGKLLSEIWSDLSLGSRDGILHQLHKYIKQLQQLELNHPGPIGGGLSEGSFFTDYGAGPFESREDIEHWFNDRLLVCHDFGHASQIPPGWFTGRFNDLVMCHLDIHPRNLILDDHGELWLIDWGFSGAYPAYFETANSIWRSHGDLSKGLVKLIQSEKNKEEVAHLRAIGFALTTGAYCQPRRQT